MQQRCNKKLKIDYFLLKVRQQKQPTNPEIYWLLRSVEIEVIYAVASFNKFLLSFLTNVMGTNSSVGAPM